jgi:translation initiation factor 2B subunit (eIF-2B alpha/beta/delta family)
VAQTIRCPVYVVVDTLKFNASSLLGLPLWLDPLPAVDVVPAGWSGYARIVGHLFDTTPARLIRGVVTERGVLSPSACAAFMHSMPLSTTLAGKLAVWLQRKQSYLVQP